MVLAKDCDQHCGLSQILKGLFRPPDPDLSNDQFVQRKALWNGDPHRHNTVTGDCGSYLSFRQEILEVRQRRCVRVKFLNRANLDFIAGGRNEKIEGESRFATFLVAYGRIVVPEPGHAHEVDSGFPQQLKQATFRQRLNGQSVRPRNVDVLGLEYCDAHSKAVDDYLKGMSSDEYRSCGEDLVLVQWYQRCQVFRRESAVAFPDKQAY